MRLGRVCRFRIIASLLCFSSCVHSGDAGSKSMGIVAYCDIGGRYVDNERGVFYRTIFFEYLKVVEGFSLT